MRPVKNKSIPNVSDERLLVSQAQIHHVYHTPEGLRGVEQRREMVDMGIKGRKISAELAKRGHPRGDCNFCWGFDRV